MTTLTTDQTLPDVHLIGRRDEAAIQEMAERVHRRQAAKMRPLVIAKPAQLEKASAPMLEVLAEEGVASAVAEVERRRVAGEVTG